MADLKTKANDASVEQFFSKQSDDVRADCEQLTQLMQQAADAPPKMWGPSIVGFGECHCTYASGRDLDWFLIGFSPRKGKLSLYFMTGFEAAEELLATLGKFKLAKSCLYAKSLSDLHVPTLKKLLQQAVTSLKAMPQVEVRGASKKPAKAKKSKPK